jgi:uncharacterized membrane-anchored protein
MAQLLYESSYLLLLREDLMMNLRRLFLICVAVFCQFPSRVALGDSLYRLDEEYFSMLLDPTLRFIDAEETARIMIKDWGNPAAHVMEQNPLGMIVAQDFPKSVRWGIVITASHDGHIPDQDADRMQGNNLLQILRKEYLRMNKQRRAAGSAPVTRLDWALEPQYNPQSHHIAWAKDLSFGRDGSRTLNYSVRILGRENAIHLNAVGPMDELDAITRSMQSVVAASAFDEGFRYEDFNPLYHRTANYGLTGLVTGQPQMRLSRFQNLWQNMIGSSNLMIAGLFGFAVALGRWLTRRRLPEF